MKKMRIYLNREEIEALSKWDDCPNSLIEKLGLQECYLIEVTNNNTGVTRYEIYDHPLRTNMSDEVKIKGWLGETNNVNYSAMGKYDSVKAAIDSIEYDLEPAEIDDFEAHQSGLLWSGIIIPE